MANKSTADDVGARIQNALRSAAGGSAKGYLCVICSTPFKAGPKLWEHAKWVHKDSPEVTGSTDEGVARKDFLEQAQIKATSKAATSTSRTNARPSSYDNDSTRANAGGRLGTASPTRPSSAPEHIPGPGKKIDDIGNLTLGYEPAVEGQERHTSASNPRKRVAEGEFGALEPPIGAQKPSPMNMRPRHGRPTSGRLSGSHNAGLSRRDPPANDQEYVRTTPDCNQRLWDPEVDATGKGTRRVEDRAVANPDPPFQSLKDQPPSRQQDWSTHQKLGYDTPRPHTFVQGRPVMHQSNTSYIDKARPGKSEEDHKHPNEDSPLQDEPPEASEAEPEMLLQPETRPISHEQLVVEVKGTVTLQLGMVEAKFVDGAEGIYAGLVMVEAKCIDIDERQSAAAQEKDMAKRTDLKNDQWQSLIALHKQLLHEHHDFFLASQHPSASSALSRLAAKYSMPARMWRHGIHAFLEVLRHRLPESLEHMLAFIYIAYSMMALLYETVPGFEDTWIECLGDLGRYRMAIEDDEPKDREVWSNVARFWYNKASDKSPNVGRLYHHLAILARPYTLEQLSLYTRSLTCVTPFESAKGSIMTLFNPIIHGKDTIQRRPSSLETVFIKIHGILFTSNPLDPSERFDAAFEELKCDGLFMKYISKAGARFKENGVFAAVSNMAALFEYGVPSQEGSKPPLRLAYEAAKLAEEEPFKASSTVQKDVTHVQSSNGSPQTGIDGLSEPSTDYTSNVFSQSSKLAFYTLEIALDHPKDKNVYPLVHVYLVFLSSLLIVQQACASFERGPTWKIIEKDIPWMSICLFLNILAAEPQARMSRIWNEEFPKPIKGIGRPLPEDFILRGQLYTEWYFPENWFVAAMVDDDERSLDLPSMALPRIERILSLGHRIASADRWMRYDKQSRLFCVTENVNEIKARIQPDIGSNDQDSNMPDADTTYSVSRTTSLATSDSLAPSKGSTRASTPTESHVTDGLAEPGTPRALNPEDTDVDVPMMDVSPEKEQGMVFPGELTKSGIPSWPQDNSVDPGVPSSKGQNMNEFLSGPQKLAAMVDHETPEPQKPR